MPSRRRVLAAGCLALTGGSGCARIRDAVVTEPPDDGTKTGTTTSKKAETGAETNAAASEFRVTVTDDGGEVELVTGADVASVGDVERPRTGDGYQLPVTLTDEGTAAFADGLERVGALEDPQSHRIRTYFEGEQLYQAKLGPGLADAIDSGRWEGEFLFRVSHRETAEKVKEALEDN